MWRYEQSTGLLRHNGAAVGTGYSGLDTPEVLGKNNPAAQEIHGIGPLPVGKYSIGAAYHDPELGPMAMHLTPDPENQMDGRSAFLIHADSYPHPDRKSAVWGNS